MRLSIVAVAILVAGCGSRQQQQPERKIEIHTAAQQQLHKASALNRAIGLKRAIYDSGLRCQRITRSGFIGNYKNLEMWMAACANGKDWAVFIGPDGSAQVRDCRDVAQFGLPKCVIKSEEARAGNVVGG